MIKTEAKGSVNEDNRKKNPSISNSKRSIEEKKEAERDVGSVASDSMLYGTIAVLDNRDDSVARCWLLDPPARALSSPHRFRILARLNAIGDLVSFISPRSQLSSALQTRLAALHAIEALDSLDGVPLRKGDGGDFPTKTYDLTGRHNPWFASKSRIADGPTGGQVLQLDRENLLFLGIREELLTYIIEQSFDTISSYKFSSGTVHKRVICSVSTGRFKSEFSIGENRGVRVTKSGGYVQFELEGYMHYSSGGMVFGILPLSEVRIDK